LYSPLSWKSHINTLFKKPSCVCFKIRKSTYILNKDTLRIQYCAHFQSLINKGIIFWGSSTTLHNVFLIPNRVIRIMLGLGPRSSCTGGFKKLRLYQVCIFLHSKCLLLEIQTASRLTPQYIVRT
jgi:hypothetical protein